MRVAQARTIDPPTRMDPEVLEAAGVTRAAQFLGHVEDARRELFDGLKLVDSPDDRDLHEWGQKLVLELDDLRCYLAARGQVER